jgi:hypothetical protein
MEVWGRKHETGWQKWQSNCSVVGQSQAIYLTLVAEQYRTAKQHNMHMTELESMKHANIIYDMVEKPPLSNLWQLISRYLAKGSLGGVGHGCTYHV